MWFFSTNFETWHLSLSSNRSISSFSTSIISEVASSVWRNRWNKLCLKVGASITQMISKREWYFPFVLKTTNAIKYLLYSYIIVVLMKADNLEYNHQANFTGYLCLFKHVVSHRCTIKSLFRWYCKLKLKFCVTFGLNERFF